MVRTTKAYTYEEAMMIKMQLEAKGHKTYAIRGPMKVKKGDCPYSIPYN